MHSRCSITVAATMGSRQGAVAPLVWDCSLAKLSSIHRDKTDLICVLWDEYAQYSLMHINWIWLLSLLASIAFVASCHSWPEKVFQSLAYYIKSWTRSKQISPLFGFLPPWWQSGPPLPFQPHQAEAAMCSIDTILCDQSNYSIITRKCGNYSDVLPLKAARRDSINSEGG